MWKKGLFKVFKKGDLRECNNWRGVTLLPVINKIFCRILLEQIKKGVDKKLQKEQAGLSLYLEQANEWRASLYAHFVDFEKAFDSVQYSKKLWDTRQDGESDSGHKRGLGVSS